MIRWTGTSSAGSKGPRNWPIHDFVVMVTADGQEIGIDEAIVFLIKELGSHGVRTDSSCQGGYATLYGAQPGYVNYNAEDHDAVVGVIERAGLTGVEYLPGPSEKRYLKTVEFDPSPNSDLCFDGPCYGVCRLDASVSWPYRRHCHGPGTFRLNTEEWRYQSSQQPKRVK